MSESKARIRPEESLEKMISSLKEKTGRTLDEWKEVVATSGWKAHGEITKGLKEGFGVSHGYANQIALRVREAPQENADPIADMFGKRPDAKAIFDVLLPKILDFGQDVDLAPKKGYVSLRRNKQFAILQPAAGRLDVGIQLKGVAPQGRLEASGSFNAMLSHRVKVSTPKEVDDELMGWLKQAYELAV
jgi:hypothetical protein